MSTEDLSKRQIQVYDSIVAHVQEYGFAPTVRELCKLTGLASTSTIIGHLKTLEKKGYIKRYPTHPKLQYYSRCVRWKLPKYKISGITGHVRKAKQAQMMVT